MSGVPAQPVVQLHDHGYPELRADGRILPLPLKRGLALLLLLADTARPVARDHVARLLWPEAGSCVGRGRLRRLAHEVNSRTEWPLLAGDPATIVLSPAFRWQCETVAVRAAATRVLAAASALPEDLAALLAPRSDRVADGFALDSGPFGDWLARRRDEHERLVAAALLKVVRGASQADPALAVAAAERAAAIDPCNEQAWLAAIRLQVQLGDAAAAQAAYARCAQALRRELGIAPSAAFEAECAALLGPAFSSLA